MRLRPRIATALALLLAALCCAVPAVASAQTVRERIQGDCTDGQINGHYTTAQLADALAHLPADADEYTDCSDVIRRAELTGGGGSSSGGGSSPSGGGAATGGGTTGGGTTGGGVAGGDADATAPAPDPLAAATDAQRAAFARAVQAGNAPVEVDGRPIHPGELGGTKTSGVGDLPAPLLAILALLILAGLGAAGFGTHRFVHGRRSA
jgi:hypothetical protein